MITREEIMEARKNYLVTTEPVVNKLINTWVEENFNELKSVGVVELNDDVVNSSKDQTKSSLAGEILDYYYDSPVTKSIIIRAFAKLGLYLSVDQNDILISFKPA